MTVCLRLFENWNTKSSITSATYLATGWLTSEKTLDGSQGQKLA